MNLVRVLDSTEYDLVAEEDTNLFLGKAKAFTCSNVERPGSITHWLKDGVKVASSKPLTKFDMEKLFKEHSLRTSLGVRPRRIKSFIPPNIDDDNSVTTSTEFTVLSYGRLYLRNITMSHSGKYSCIIEHYGGKLLRRQFGVTVIGKCCMLECCVWYSKMYGDNVGFTTQLPFRSFASA